MRNGKYSLRNLLRKIAKYFNRHSQPPRQENEKQQPLAENPLRKGADLRKGQDVDVSKQRLYDNDQKLLGGSPKIDHGSDSGTCKAHAEKPLPNHEPFEWLLEHGASSVTDRNSAKSENVLARDTKKATRRLRHDQYTVGWICALPKEMTAAKAMLDEVHLPLSKPIGDHNTYQLGAIRGHNVVIACLRSGVYGTSSATATAVAMSSTYPNSNIMPLLVGIGGGVPSMRDIRLGDVVMSDPSSKGAAVLQYDLGTSTGNGDVEARGALNKPGPALLSALANYKADLILRPSTASKYIKSAIEEFALDKSTFSYPGSEKDLLFEPECQHFQQGRECKRCSMALMARLPRANTDPVIYNGTVGSGNQVIKHARIRDRIATRHQILCFEMEAAGVMDYVPCLVIRGICDYCDTHKNKIWQEYAALAAAAVAKEFLSRTSPSLVEDVVRSGGDMAPEKRRKLFKSLDFEDRHARRDNIKRAHPQTCKWVLNQHEYLAWTTANEYQSHSGLLWMKGKPGAGKSTIMKYLSNHMERLCEGSTSVIVVSFFFNARGGELARSTIGLYRSLITQILERIPGLQSLLDQVRGSEEFFEVHKWTIPTLEELFRSIVKLLGRMHLVCYIDALDECSEDQIREMVGLFDQLADLAEANHLYVCFSSRHYPHITMKRGLSFILEHQVGHAEDIKKYLNSELIFDEIELVSELKTKIYTKSGGVFLWTVLVVQILSREYDRGGVHKLLGLLDEIPIEVDKLFRDILTRDSDNLPQLVTSIRWVLYAKRALHLQELYHILRYPDPLHDLNMAQGIHQPAREVMQRYLLSCSKGMVEMTTSTKEIIQFIHETVREFMLQPAVLRDLWPGFEGIFEGASHELLKQYCHEHAKIIFRNKNQEASPFREYAIRHVLDHAEEAQCHGISQDNFIEEFDHTAWISQYNFLLSTDKWKRLSPSGSFGLCLAERTCFELLSLWIEKARIKPDWAEVSAAFVSDRVAAEDWPALAVLITTEHNAGNPKTSAVACADIFQSILDAKAMDSLALDNATEIAATVDALRLGAGATLDQLNQAFHFAARRLVPAAMDLFLQFGADINSIVNDYPATCQVLRLKPAWFEETLEDCTMLLIRNGANFDILGEDGKSPLRHAIYLEQYSIIGLLLDEGVNVYMKDLESCLDWPGISKTVKNEILAHHREDDADNVDLMLAQHMNEPQTSLAIAMFQQFRQRTQGSARFIFRHRYSEERHLSNVHNETYVSFVPRQSSDNL